MLHQQFNAGFVMSTGGPQTPVVNTGK